MNTKNDDAVPDNIPAFTAGNADALTLKGWQQENAELQDQIAELEKDRDRAITAMIEMTNERDFAHNKIERIRAENEALKADAEAWDAISYQHACNKYQPFDRAFRFALDAARADD